MTVRTHERARSASWLVVPAAQGAVAGMAIAAVLGGWAVYLNGDAPHGMEWIALGRLLPGVTRLGAAGLVASTVLALAIAWMVRFGRWARIGAAVAVLGLGAWGGWLAYGPYRSVAFPLELSKAPRLTGSVIALAIGIGGLLVVARAVDGLRGKRPEPPGRLAAGACRAIFVVWFLTALAHLAYPAIGTLRARGRPSIILVSLDTLRADRLGFLGNTRGLTPHLDALAAEGVVFERAFATAPWTLASHASLFTSKLPFVHQARLDFQKIKPRQRMLAEDLREAGYRTAAFTADGYVAAAFGFEQGFEIYDETDDRKDDSLPLTLDRALRWIRRVKDEPFFAFVHTYEVHSPYTHTDRADPAMRGRLGDRFTNAEIEAIRAGRLTLTLDERRWVQGLYDGDVACADRLVGEFLETLKRDGILDRAILVVFSDHGEDLWDHSVERSPGHGHSLYQELIRVPLLMRWPNSLAANARIAANVSLLDVAPTLLELAGLQHVEDYRGRSLAENARSGIEPPAIPVTAESTEYGPDRFAVIDGSWEVIYTPWPQDRNMGVALKVAPLEIFDLASDPGEKIDLSPRLEELPPAVIEMVAAARARAVAERPSPKEDRDNPEVEPPSEELMKRLKALGYVQ